MDKMAREIQRKGERHTKSAAVGSSPPQIQFELGSFWRSPSIFDSPTTHVTHTQEDNRKCQHFFSFFPGHAAYLDESKGARGLTMPRCFCNSLSIQFLLTCAANPAMIGRAYQGDMSGNFEKASLLTRMGWITSNRADGRKCMGGGEGSASVQQI